MISSTRSLAVRVLQSSACTTAWLRSLSGSSQIVSNTLLTPAIPRLLVSVRNVAELDAAMTGGVDIVDVKEPLQGPLGMAALDEIQAITARMQARSSPGKTKVEGLSVALGELGERQRDAAPLRLPADVSWAKLGLAGLRDRPDWQQQWVSMRQRMDAATGRRLRWIAVAYADEIAAQSPAMEEILAAAGTTGCWGLLIDTYSKSGGSLLDWMSPEMIRQISAAARRSSIALALAGKVTVADLPVLCGCEPAIIAVRSAVCPLGDRTRAVTADGVANFRQALLEAATRVRSIAAAQTTNDCSRTVTR